MNKTISISETLKFSWRAFLDNALILVVLTILTLVVQLLFGAFSCGTDDVPDQDLTSGVSCTLFSVLYYLANVFIAMGFATIGLHAVQGDKITFKQFFSRFSKFFPFVIAMILYAIIVFVGLILFIVPGIIWAIKFSMYPFMVLDKGANGWDALKLSSQATHGVKWDLLGLYAILILISLAGLLLFGLGLFITIPLTWIAQAHVFRKITEVGTTP